MKGIRVLLPAAALAVSTFNGFAQTSENYPNRTVRVIVASGPGGGTDVPARFFSQALSESMKQAFIVDNRPGAGDTLGTALAAKAPPDGYTLMMVAPTFAIIPALYPKSNLDPVKDFAPISQVISSVLLLMVHPSLPAKSVKELIALARARPDTIDGGVGANGTFTHLATVAFATSAKVKINAIPYANTGQRYADAISGQTAFVFMPGPLAVGYIKGGRLRALGVSSRERSPGFPNLPTLHEGGAIGYDFSTWFGWVAPRGTPAPIVNRLYMELAATLKRPDILKRIADDGADPVGSTPEQFAQFIADQVPRFRKAVADSGIKLE